MKHTLDISRGIQNVKNGQKTPENGQKTPENGHKMDAKTVKRQCRITDLLICIKPYVTQS